MNFVAYNFCSHIKRSKLSELGETGGFEKNQMSRKIVSGYS